VRCPGFLKIKVAAAMILNGYKKLVKHILENFPGGRLTGKITCFQCGCLRIA